MYREKSPSLFLPRLVAILLIIILLSGMTEITFLAASFKHPNNYKLVDEKFKNLHESLHDAHDVDGMTKAVPEAANN